MSNEILDEGEVQRKATALKEKCRKARKKQDREREMSE